MDADGKVDFFDTSYTKNGRTTWPFAYVDPWPPEQLAPAEFLLILNRNENIVPGVARLDRAQAAAYFMLGETTGTSAGGKDEEGKFLRIPGTNPFFPRDMADMGNRMLELLDSHELQVFVLNTGRVGGGEAHEGSKKVKIPHSSAIVQAIVEDTITWTTDPELRLRGRVLGARYRRHGDPPAAAAVPAAGADGRVRRHGRAAQAGTPRVPRLVRRPGRGDHQVHRLTRAARPSADAPGATAGAGAAVPRAPAPWPAPVSVPEASQACRGLGYGAKRGACGSAGYSSRRPSGHEGCRMGLRSLVYRLYTRRLGASLAGKPVPRHVGVILDGNRRWARAAGMPDFSGGYRKGGDRVFELLQWCDEAGVEVVTLWLLSTDNLNRPAKQLAPLLRVIEETVQGLVAQHWHINPMGALDLLPDETARVLKDAAEATAGYGGLVVNVGVGYGGRQEIADAVRSLLHDHASKGTSIEELAEILDIEHIAGHLYTRGQPDPDLVIRTSGEQRLSGFLLWQSAHSEFYFCDAYWPDFRKVDFLRALRDYAARQRRYGA